MTRPTGSSRRRARRYVGAAVVARGGRGTLAMDLFVAFMFAGMITPSYVAMRLWQRL